MEQAIDRGRLNGYFRDKGRKGYLVIEQLTEASPEAF
jgi:hypothetical protein